MRIDDRLIHGQVIAVWCRRHPFTRIVIADDDVAADAFLRTVLELAAPSHLRLDVLTLEESARVLSEDKPDRATTMVLLKSPAAAKRLFDGGVTFDTLNVGGIAGGPGRKNVFRNIALSPADVAVLEQLKGEGVRVILQTLPGERSRDFADLAGKV